MNVLSDILCDTSPLLTSQNYKTSSSENTIMCSQEMFVGQGPLNLLDSTSHISTIEGPLPPVNHSSPSNIGLFSSANSIHIGQDMNTDFEDRNESVFSDPFAEIVPSWLTHDFMKVSENLSSSNILSNVSDIYPSTQEDEHLEMLDLGFTSDLTSHDLATSDLNRNCIDSQKLLADLPMQRYSNREPILLSSLDEINVPHMPVKNNLQYQKFKQSAEVNNSPNLMNTVLQCKNELVHLPIHSDLTSQCLTVNSSPSIMPDSQSHHNPVNSVCDKLPQLNLNHLNSFLGNDISAMQLLHQDFPTMNLSEADLNHANNNLGNCRPDKMEISSNTRSLMSANSVPLNTTQDASVQVSSGNSIESENCMSCNKVNLDAPIEAVLCFKCKFCDFISIHKCSVQNHLCTSHSKSLNVPNGTSFDQTSTIITPPLPATNASQNSYLTSNGIVSSATVMPLNSHLNNSIFLPESTYIQSDNQVISKSNFVSGHNLNSAPVQLHISESAPISYQLIPISGVVLNSESKNENNNIFIDSNTQYMFKDLGSNLNMKQRPILKKPEELSTKKFTEPKKVCSKSNKDEVMSEKLISAQKKGWRKKIRRELGSYICEFKGCNVRFKALDNLEYHRKCHISGGNAFACPECGMSFNNWSSIAGHLWRNHSNDMELHACDICSFRTYSLSRLENYHKKTHLDECQFLCDTCGKKFKNRKQLRNHRAIHSKNRSVEKRRDFTCRICLSNFASKSLLNSHQDLAHNLKRKNHLCSYCDYSTCKKATMDLHMRQHTGEKPFHCDKCEYKTSDHNSLRRHKMIHSGERGYTCPYCPYSSIQASVYKDHLKRKHPGQDLIYSCKICPFRTVKFETYGIHMEEHESIYKHKQLPQMNEINSTEEILPLVEAMGIRLSNGDSLGYLSNSGNSQTFVNTVNMKMISICQDSSNLFCYEKMFKSF